MPGMHCQNTSLTFFWRFYTTEEIDLSPQPECSLSTQVTAFKATVNSDIGV